MRLMSDRGRPDIDQANKNPKSNKTEPQNERGDTLLRERRHPLFADSGRASSEIPE